jgi:hypothetical protein
MKKQAFQGGGQINMCSSKLKQDAQMMAVVATQVGEGGGGLMNMVTRGRMVEVKKRYSNRCWN